MVRRAFAIAVAAGSLAACAQVLGIEAIHDDPADASTPVDGSLAPETSPGDGAAVDAGADATIDATAPVPDGGLDAPLPDAGPTVDPARGCAALDGSPATFFTNVATFPQNIAVDRAGIYLSDAYDLRRCSLEGCDAGGVTLVFPSEPQSFTTDDEHVVFCANGNVEITDSNGTVVHGFLANDGCTALAARGLDVYWASGPTTIRHGVDGPDAASNAVTNGVQGVALAIAPTSQWLFYLDQDPDAGTTRVVRCDLPSCAGGEVVLATATNSNTVVMPTITANERAVFWGDPGGRQLLACDVGGCDGGPRVIAADAAVSSVHADDGALYWANSESSTFGDVHETPLDGGPTVTLATNHRTPGHLTANAACVYWTDDGFAGSNSRGAVLGVRQP